MCGDPGGDTSSGYREEDLSLWPLFSAELVFVLGEGCESIEDAVGASDTDLPFAIFAMPETCNSLLYV